jgi:diacylglycerol kinase (ATP)
MGWRRVRVICNPHAGFKAGLPVNFATPEAVRELMARHGLGDDLVLPDSEAAAAAAAREAVAAGYDLVVAAGGDGTAGTIACELLGRTTALGLLPLGSVMNIARSLGLPRDLEGAAAVIAAGATRRIDVGEARGQLFFETGSVGMNAAIFREVTRIDRGDWRGVLTAIWVAVRYRPARMRLHLDDQVVQTRALLVTVSNGQYTGIGFTVAPEARLDDGLFDVRVFRGFSRWELLRHFAAIAFGRRRYSPKIATYRSASVRVESARPLPCRADAYDLGTTPVSFALRPGALRIVIPAGQELAENRGRGEASAAGGVV